MSDTEKAEVITTPLTARETELAVIALQCLQGNEIKIDYDKLTLMANYKNRNTAMTVLSSLLKHKLSNSTVNNYAVPHSSGSATASGPKKRTLKAKAKAVATDDDNADTTNDTTPEKPKKKRATKPKPAAVAEPTDDDDANKANGTTDGVTLKKRARKEKSSTPAAAKRVKQEHKHEPEVKEEEAMPAGARESDGRMVCR